MHAGDPEELHICRGTSRVTEQTQARATQRFAATWCIFEKDAPWMLGDFFKKDCGADCVPIARDGQMKLILVE